MTAEHTPESQCGCCLEPVDDATEPSDLCSEATGANNGVGWRIRQCPLHAAAEELLEALKEIGGTSGGGSPKPPLAPPVTLIAATKRLAHIKDTADAAIEKAS